jgi:GntR family transcriptional regulator
VADPMWKQIAESLRQRIDTGELGHDGMPLPTELELQDEYSASRNTVRDAIKWLVARNLVYTRSGQGTFVTQQIDPFVTRLSTELSAHIGIDSAAYVSEVARQSRRAAVSAPRIEIQLAASLAANDELQLPGDANVLSRHQQRYIDGVPYSLQTTFYPMRLVEQGAIQLIQAQDIDMGAVGYIEQTLGIKQVSWRDRIQVRVPDANEAAFFGLPDDGRIAVFEFTRTGFDASGQPFRVTVTTYPADRNQFVMTSRTAPDEVAGHAAAEASQGDERGNNESASKK